MANRHVPGRAGLDREGQADQLGMMGIEAGCLRIESETFRTLQGSDPLCQLIIGRNTAVLGLLCIHPGTDSKLLQQLKKLALFEKLAQLFQVGLVEDEIMLNEIELNIINQRHQLL